MADIWRKNVKEFHWREYRWSNPVRIIRRKGHIMIGNIICGLLAIIMITLFFFGQRYYGQSEPQMVVEKFFMNPPFSLTTGKSLIDEIGDHNIVMQKLQDTLEDL